MINYLEIASIKVDSYQLEKEEYDCSRECGVSTKAESLFVSSPITKDSRTITTSIYKNIK